MHISSSQPQQIAGCNLHINCEVLRTLAAPVNSPNNALLYIKLVPSVCVSKYCISRCDTLYSRNGSAPQVSNADCCKWFYVVKLTENVTTKETCQAMRGVFVLYLKTLCVILFSMQFNSKISSPWHLYTIAEYLLISTTK
jgi:hypothetical protein